MLDDKYIDLLHKIDKRLAVLEERTTGLPELKTQAARTSGIVAIIISALAILFDRFSR